MKKLIYTLIIAFLLVPNFLQSQTIAGPVGSITTYPKVYTYDEEVTWYFDLSQTTFAENEDVYIWIWSPSEPDAGNWGNSSDFAKLNYEGDFKWSFTLTPTTYFNVSAEAIAASAGFWFILKDKTGTKNTDPAANVSYTPFDDFYTAGEMIRSYPTAPTLDGALSILFNSNLVPGFEDAASVHMHSGLNDWSVLQEYQAWIPEIVEKTKLKNLGNGFYKMDLIPSVYYSTPEGFIMENIRFLFVKDEWAGTSPDQVIFAAAYIPPPPPQFSYFPTMISQKDFLGIIRINNEEGINALNYTITAGTTVITGQFTGGISSIKGFVDLPTKLAGLANLTQLHVLVTDNEDRVISDVIIPLKILD